MKIKEFICKAAAKTVKKAAINASCSASFMGFYQPVEPKELKNLKK